MSFDPCNDVHHLFVVVLELYNYFMLACSCGSSLCKFLYHWMSAVGWTSLICKWRVKDCTSKWHLHHSCKEGTQGRHTDYSHSIYLWLQLKDLLHWICADQLSGKLLIAVHWSQSHGERTSGPFPWFILTAHLCKKFGKLLRDPLPTSCVEYIYPEMPLFSGTYWNIPTLIKYVPWGSILKMRKLAKMFEKGNIEILI